MNYIFLEKLKPGLFILLGSVIPKFLMILALKVSVNDKTFSGLVRRRLAFDRSQDMVTFVDKDLVHEYISRKSKTVLMPHRYQVTGSAADLDPALWPEEYVIKPTFGSGALVMVTKSAWPGLKYGLVNKKFRWDRGQVGILSEGLDLDELKNLANQWLSSDYEYWTLKLPEWAYGRVPKKIIVEEIVRNTDGSRATELRIHCYGGKAALIRITDVLGGRGSWSFDPEGNPTDVRLDYEATINVGLSPLPSSWKEAVAEAEKISRGVDYIRVDLYSTDKGIYFSELTPYPNGGWVDFRPLEISQKFAGLWRMARSD